LNKNAKRLVIQVFRTLHNDLLDRHKQKDWASFIFTLHLAEKWQRHPAADLRGYKPLLQFTIFSPDKSINYFYLKMKDAKD